MRRTTAFSATMTAVLLGALLTCSPGGPGAQGTKQWPLDPDRVSPFGINSHLPSLDDYEAMRKAGIEWTRIDLTWDVVEPERGKYRWDLVDRVVADAEVHQVHLLGILGYSPKWASSGPTQYHPPRHKKEWKNFVHTIVSRYRGRIRHWSMWNEPNSKAFYKGSMHAYINDILIPGANAAKWADPDCRVVGPDLAHLEGADWDKWLDRTLSQAGPYLDVISHHCYKKTPDEVFRQLEGKKWPWESKPVREILESKRQGGKPFWLTETGWRTTEMSENDQAGYVIALMKGVQKRPWIKKVFLFELKDSPSLPGYGLLRLDGTPKHSFTALRGYIDAPPNQR
jgi:hypothetical protein